MSECRIDKIVIVLPDGNSISLTLDEVRQLKRALIAIADEPCLLSPSPAWTFNPKLPNVIPCVSTSQVPA
jgi:hypothetical protein